MEMKKKMDFEIGSYEWNVKIGMPQDGKWNYKSWRKYLEDETTKRLKSFNLKKGQQVSVLIGGYKSNRWFKGEIILVNYNGIGGSFITIQQKNSVKKINGSEISQIEILK
jgi:hypothetical protein